jgi:hypothetical protein
MHFEVPKSKKLREFASEYIMIVISIATALALEHLVQTVHHKHLAEEAAQRMQAELSATLAEVDKVTAHNNAQIALNDQLRDAVLKDIKDKVPEKTAMENFQRASNGKFNLSVQVPSYKHEAWDVAVANQSASWMSATELQRYSSAYSAVHDSQQLASIGMGFLSGSEYLKTMGDLKMGSSNPRDVYQVLSHMSFCYQQINNSLAELKEQLAKAVKPV